MHALCVHICDIGLGVQFVNFLINYWILQFPPFRQQFASLLSGGTLTDKQTIKMQLSNTADFGSALSAIAAGLHLGIVEHIEESASLYGCSISNHHICLLVKSLVSSSSVLVWELVLLW